MKAIKKPIPITVVEFQPDQPHVGYEVRRWNDGYEMFNGLHRSWIGLKPGDMVNVTTPRDTYPIDRKVFNETYTVIPDEGGEAGV